MLIYKDKVTDQELLPDCCPLVLKDDYYYESNVVYQESQTLDINTGANKSAEGGDDEDCDPIVSDRTALQEANLQPVTFNTKKELSVYIKSYLKW
ncbi:hypothetical protein KUTeg_018617 [Tegillarca granosa]|uniref:TCTP domain-containing protein n=1 Tax=Tegillarca granosa TaxID=220873 RepID=A0ABQ9EGM6_TEGGR|nr:hypothetical protein KUTeg_018617 [Tegillarca granosa]